MRDEDKLPRFIVAWLVVGTLIVLFDVSFVLLRPSSLEGGSLYFLYRVPYATYVEVDHSYGDVHSPFVRAQAIMSLLESIITIAALVASARRRIVLASLLAFCVSVLTAAKTTLILLIEVVSGGQSVGHNPIDVLVASYLVPNGVWIVMPIVVAVWTGRRLVRGASDTRPVPAVALRSEPA